MSRNLEMHLAQPSSCILLAILTHQALHSLVQLRVSLESYGDYGDHIGQTCGVLDTFLGSLKRHRHASELRMAL